MAVRRSARARQPIDEPTAHVDLEYPSSVPTFTVNPTQLSGSSSSAGPLPWFSAFGRKDANSPLPSEADPKYSDPLYYTSSSYGKSGRNSSHTAKKPEGHIKRPPNCFLLFRSHVKESGIRIPEALKPILKDRLKEKRREQRSKKHGPGANDEDDDDDDDDEDDNDDDEQSVSKISGILWDFLPAAEKSLFRARAAHAKEMHKTLYPHYKYSPQVKDKSVKRRVGKKMPAEKKERLEQVAEVLVQEMGWSNNGSDGGDSSSRHKKSNSSPATRNGTPSAPQYQYQQSDEGFTLNSYNHQQPRHPFQHATHNHTAPQTAPVSAYPYPTYQQQPSTSYHFGVRDDGSGTMNPAIQSAHAVNGVHPTMSTPPPPPPPPFMPTLEMGYEQPAPRMYRRTSSCPPPGAHLTWADTAHSFVPPQSSTQSTQYSQAPSLPTQPPHFTPANHTFVRPGGKTMRKLRTGTSVKQQMLNGNKRAVSSKPSSAHGRPLTPSSGMTLPSLPAVMGKYGADNGMVNGVPMSAGGGFEDQAAAQNFAQQHAWAHYDLGHSASGSATSSPATFSTIETPSSARGGMMLFPQGSQQAYAFPQQTGQQQPNYANYTTSVDPYTTPAIAGEEYVKTPQQEGEGSHLGLTMIEDNYTFPPPSQRSPKRVASPAKNMTVNVQHQSEGAYPGSPANGAARIVSPTPVTPISMQTMQSHGQQQQPARRGLEDLGVELNLDQGMGGLGGLLEFSFPPTSTSPHGHSIYSYGGSGVGDVLLSDVSLGIEQDREGEHPNEGSEKKVGAIGMGIGSGWRNQQPLVPGGPIPSNGGGMGPLDIPLHELFPAGAEFDASGYVVGPEELTSSEQLEYEMMEWRRNSETLNQQPVSPHQTAPPSPYKFGTPIAGSEEPAYGLSMGMGRRASVVLSSTLGGEMAMALYGFDASSGGAGPQEWTGAYEMEYEAANGAQYGANGFSYGQQIPQQHPLGTVVEERGSSEEAPSHRPGPVPVEVGWR